MLKYIIICNGGEEMKLFGGFRDDLIGDIFGVKKEPSILEKVDMLFTDVETEGKKQGYEKASKEYEQIFRQIENRYKETKKLIESQKNVYGDQYDKLIDKLADLENERDSLQKQVDNKAKHGLSTLFYTVFIRSILLTYILLVSYN